MHRFAQSHDLPVGPRTTSDGRPRVLGVARKLLSFKQRFQILGDGDRVIFECSWRLAWIHPRWVLTQDGRDVAVFQKRVWSISSTWDVQTVMGDFVIRRKIFSLRRHLLIEGGPLDAARFTGSLLDMSFVLAQKNVSLARARAKLLTLRDRHVVELLDDRPEVELTTAVLMTCLLVEKHQEKRAADDRNNRT